MSDINRLNFGAGNFLKKGTRHLSGVEEALLRNCEAVSDLNAMIHTSFGPNGRNKLIINHLEKIFVTSDTATMLKETEINHPAAKMVVMACNMQESEVGDATNLVLMVAGALLDNAEHLVRLGLRPSEIVQGYTDAGKKCLEILDSLVLEKLDDKFNREANIRALQSVISAKQHGFEKFLTPLVVDACMEITPKNNPGAFNVDSVRTVKIMGGGIQDTEVVKGFVLLRHAEGVVKSVTDAKVAVFTCALDQSSTVTKGTVLIEDADDLLNFTKSEEEILEASIKAIADSGCNVIVTGSGINQLALHYIEKYGMFCTKVLSKFELRRLCRAIGATPMARLGAPTAEEMGNCARVYVKEVGSTKATVFEQDDSSSMLSTILCRGATKSLMDDVERAVDDAVNVYKQLMRDGRLVAGAGACELALAQGLEAHAATVPGLEQYAIKQFADALETIPNTLAENGGHNALKLVAEIHAEHKAGNTQMGVGISSGKPVDVAEAGILDSFASKYSAIKLAIDAATTILKVDQIIMMKPAGGPKAPSQRGTAGSWDDED